MKYSDTTILKVFRYLVSVTIDNKPASIPAGIVIMMMDKGKNIEDITTYIQNIFKGNDVYKNHKDEIKAIIAHVETLLMGEDRTPHYIDSQIRLVKTVLKYTPVSEDVTGLVVQYLKDNLSYDKLHDAVIAEGDITHKYIPWNLLKAILTNNS